MTAGVPADDRDRHVEPASDTWVRRWALVVGSYVAIVLVGSIGFRAMEARAEAACHERAADRKVLTQVVDVATGNASGPVDLTKIGGFDALTPETQAYLRHLSESLSAENATDDQPPLPLHDRLVALLPPIKC